MPEPQENTNPPKCSHICILIQLDCTNKVSRNTLSITREKYQFSQASSRHFSYHPEQYSNYLTKLVTSISHACHIHVSISIQ